SLTHTSQGTGRLIFALDATASRNDTWDMACHLQGDMFKTVASTGGLSVQLGYYLDLSECRSSRWVTDTNELTRLMTRIHCRAGRTQIGKVLAHAKRETDLLKVSALVFVGDACEEEDDELIPAANALGQAGGAGFIFPGGNNHAGEHTFREITRVTHGAYCRFDSGSAKQLGELLKLVAVYAVGGKEALLTCGGEEAVKLLGQLK